MSREKEDAAEARRAKYGHLPPSVRTDDTITAQETVAARDPKAGATPIKNSVRHAGV
jgi:hypothetical protein